MAIALALLSAFLISGTTIIMKKGIERTNPTSAMLVVTVSGTLILLVVSLPQVQLAHLKSKAFPLFVLAGIFSPALVRWLYFISLDRIGPSMSSSIISIGPAFQKGEKIMRRFSWYLNTYSDLRSDSRIKSELKKYACLIIALYLYLYEEIENSNRLLKNRYQHLYEVDE